MSMAATLKPGATLYSNGFRLWHPVEKRCMQLAARPEAPITVLAPAVVQNRAQQSRFPLLWVGDVWMRHVIKLGLLARAQRLLRTA